MASPLALISVSDKTGVADFARRLTAAGFKIVSTGGTSAGLRAAGVAVRDVSDLTGFPEMLDGRVKTLHPKVHGGLLARRDLEPHMEACREHGIAMIDLLVVNLYPFAQTAANPGASRAEVIEQIDIGGPAMLRSAAKNHAHVTVVCDPADYAAVAAEIEGTGTTLPATRARLAGKVFRHTAAYDAAIADYLATAGAQAASPETIREEAFPAVLTLSLPLGQQLRYGENPHQRAAFYRDPACAETNVAGARQLQGKELSYNNILDAEGALEAVRDFAGLAPAAAIIVKHSNPCGIALGDDALAAYTRARETDPDSAFGGIVALSCELDAPTAEAIAATFNEVILAPSVTAEAREVFAAKKNLRVLETGPFTPKQPGPVMRSVVGGMLVMDRDLGSLELSQLRLVTTATPHEEDLHALLFAWRCVKWVKSNAIVYTSRDATLGIGAGQMSRVDSARIGAQKSRASLAGCYMASDAFFPFADSVEEAASKGVRGIIQPGGSIRDEEVIAAAERLGLIMVLTGMRHFRH